MPAFKRSSASRLVRKYALRNPSLERTAALCHEEVVSMYRLIRTRCSARGNCLRSAGRNDCSMGITRKGPPGQSGRCVHAAVWCAGKAELHERRVTLYREHAHNPAQAFQLHT